MSGFAVFWLVVFAIAFLAVLFVRARAARALRAGNEELAAPTGSEFARALLEARGLGVVTVIAADVDAYRAIPREIQLADGRFDHGSPSAWAIAALEVAHAAQHESGRATWRRWWVVSGHTVWAGPVLFLALLVQLVVTSPLLVLLSFLGIGVLAASAALSLRVERLAVETARELIAGSALSREAAAMTDPPLRWAARAYVAESIFDLGFLDRAVEDYRGPDVGGGSGAF